MTAPGTERSGWTTGPAAIRLSLLASARRLPARSVSRVNRQAGESDDGVHHDVGGAHHVGECARHLCEGQRILHASAVGLVADNDDGRPELFRLTNERVDRRTDGERNDLVRPALGANDIECLRADGAGRAGDRNAGRGYCTQG